MQYKIANDINIFFHEILNPYRAFLMPWTNIMDILYYGVKEMHFSAHALLEELPYYEVIYLINKYNDEVKEKNKQQEAEREQTQEMISDIKRNQRMAQSNPNNRNTFKTPDISMPKNFPKIG